MSDDRAGGGPHIVVVDDSAHDRMAVSRALTRGLKGPRITEVESEEDWARALNGDAFDLAIVDYFLPWVTGIELVRTLREAKPGLPVIMLTGTADEDTAFEAMHEGLEEYLPKVPESYLALPRTVRFALERARQRRQLFDTNEALQRATEELRRTAEFRERFLGVVSHDVRGLLSIITLQAQTLRRNPKPAVVERASGRIEATAARMHRMVSELLDFTQSRLGGGLPIRRAPFDFFAVCRQVAEDMAQSEPCNVAVEEKGDGRGEWDEDRVVQVVQNLVGNALRYRTPNTSVKVGLSADAGSVQIAVNNQGPVILPELLNILFEPFQRGENRRDESGEQRGLGLGLFIVQEIVRAHGGRAWASSSIDEGTTFYVRFPR